jgi:hypothetical protein
LTVRVPRPTFASSGSSVEARVNGILMMESLVQVPWFAVARSHGNPEASLTGLLAAWWIGLAPKHNEVLEGGLAFTRRETAPAKGRGSSKKKCAAGGPACDLVLCLRGEPIGLVEVESSNPLAALDRLEQMLASEIPELASVRFAMAVLHAYHPSGKGAERGIASAWSPELAARAAELSGRFCGKNLVLLRLDKRYERLESGLRSLNELYWGTLDEVEGLLLRDGEEQVRRHYDFSLLHAGDTVLV